MVLGIGYHGLPIPMLVLNIAQLPVYSVVSKSLLSFLESMYHVYYPWSKKLSSSLRVFRVSSIYITMHHIIDDRNPFEFTFVGIRNGFLEHWQYVSMCHWSEKKRKVYNESRNGKILCSWCITPHSTKTPLLDRSRYPYTSYSEPHLPKIQEHSKRLYNKMLLPYVEDMGASKAAYSSLQIAFADLTMLSNWSYHSTSESGIHTQFGYLGNTDPSTLHLIEFRPLWIDFGEPHDSKNKAYMKLHEPLWYQTYNILRFSISPASLEWPEKDAHWSISWDILVLIKDEELWFVK